MSTATVEIRQAECHDTCLDVEGPNGHISNVNPIGYTDPVQWRVDCDCCYTCIRAGFATKREAVEVAKAHVLLSVDEFWHRRDSGLE